MRRTRPRRQVSLRVCSIAVGVVAWAGQAVPALAACPSDNLAVLCNPALVGDGPRLTQADIDNPTDALTTTVWVLDGTTTVRLPAGGDYTPAVPVGLGLPTIFVTEDASLVIEDAGSTGVDLDANIVLCDAASLEIRDSELRFGSTDAVTFAVENSQVVLAGATISGPGAGAVSQVFANTATLTATPTAFPSVRSGSGSVNWAFGDTSTANIVNAQLFASIQVGADASVAVSESSYVEMVLESCEGDTLTIDGLPEACDLGSTCFAEAHPVTTFGRTAPFAMQLTDTQVYAWRAVSHPGSATNIGDVPSAANLAVDLSGDFGISALTFPPGDVPEGLNDRTIAVFESDIFAWSVWASGTSDLSIEPGSVLGGLTCMGDALCAVAETTFTEGAVVRVLDSARATVDASTLGGDVLNAGAALELLASTLTGDLVVAGPTWLAETSYQVAYPSGDGVLHVVELDTPVDGATVQAGVDVEIQGSLYAQGTEGTVRPFPLAVVELRSIRDRETTVLAPLESGAEDALLFTWDTTAAAPGDYEVVLRFEQSETAIVRRRVTVTSTAGETTSGTSGGAEGSSTSSQDDGGTDPTEPSTSSTSSTSAPPSDPTTAASGETGESEDTDGGAPMTGAVAGCTVQSGGPRTLGWALLGLCFVRRRRRTSPD